MSRPEDFSLQTNSDEKGSYVQVSATLRTANQLDFLVSKLPVFRQFIEPELRISALAADRFVDSDVLPVVVPALRLIASNSTKPKFTEPQDTLQKSAK